MDQDISGALQAQVTQAQQDKTPLQIRGGGSKGFLGRISQGELLDVSPHSGIVHYEPTELVITARAGTPLNLIEQTLAEQGQMLAFEPPAFGSKATLGGTIACNLSGPRRAFAGAARDFLLGVQLLNGRGEIIRFGGEVMKNVAGYDVSRLMAGAMGTLGVMLEISLKVLPIPEQQLTLALDMNTDQALRQMQQWMLQPLPISALSFYDHQLFVRLSGTPRAVEAAQQTIGGDLLQENDHFWRNLREQKHPFFDADDALWRLSLANDAAPLALDGDWLYDWGGALRWYRGPAGADRLQQLAANHDGHASLFRSPAQRDRVFQPLTPVLQRLHRNLKQAFDPAGILNPGRLYADL
jgi:glycolate oxidase FAD binding subunit